MPLVYPELRRIARAFMRRERKGHTLQTSALINEAYLRLIGSGAVEWRDRTHFMAVCARLMRRILVDFARNRECQKRGSGNPQFSLDGIADPSFMHSGEVLKLDDALNEISKVYPNKAQVIEMRFFGGLSVEETAEVLGVSTKTVIRHWQFARAWLHRELST